MDIVGRVKNICLAPKTEWAVISEERTATSELITGYVLPLAAIGAVAGLIGGSLVGLTLPFVGTYRVSLTAGIATAVFAVCSAVIGVFLISAIINALAPTFRAEKNSAQALKVAVYSFTPAWVAGVFQILPALSILTVFGGLYGLYLLYLGLPRLMKCSQEKAVGYTAIVVVAALVVSLVLGAVAATISGSALVGAGRRSGAPGGGAAGSSASVDPDSALGRLGQVDLGTLESMKDKGVER